MSSVSRLGYLVLLSGGIDSATALYLVRRNAARCSTLSILYHRRNRREAEAARAIAEAAGVEEHVELDLGFLREAVDLGAQIRAEVESHGAPLTLIPFRNLVFYSVGCYCAWIRGLDRVVAGHNAEDSQLFPDVGRNLLSSFNELVGSMLPWRRVEVEAPLMGLSKLEVVRLALELGVPLELTWSCWREGEVHCGVCEGCRKRKEVFRELGIRDRTEYAE
ncbi:MAG: 7-cyano-7-deazaguanine synthase [Nitrososphaerota archaeon]